MVSHSYLPEEPSAGPPRKCGTCHLRSTSPKPAAVLPGSTATFGSAAVFGSVSRQEVKFLFGLVWVSCAGGTNLSDVSLTGRTRSSLGGSQAMCGGCLLHVLHDESLPRCPVR